jgi:hypothetical protein
MTLLEAFGKPDFPSVNDIVNNVESKSSKDNFAKVTSSGKDYYFLESDLQKIATNPEAYVVQFSSKHNANFIVPNNQSKGFSSF